MAEGLSGSWLSCWDPSYITDYGAELRWTATSTRYCDRYRAVGRMRRNTDGFWIGMERIRGKDDEVRGGGVYTMEDVSELDG